MNSMIDPMEAQVLLTSLSEVIKKNSLKPRWFKVGDILKWTPAYSNIERVRERGVAIVIKAEGPKIKVYWTGDGKVSDHDVRLPQQFQLQDIEPMPQVSEWVKAIQSEYV